MNFKNEPDEENGISHENQPESGSCPDCGMGEDDRHFQSTHGTSTPTLCPFLIEILAQS